jgi:hypothetical protein
MSDTIAHPDQKHHPVTPGDGHTGATLAVEDEIATRAYEISESSEAGTPEENWLRAEREMRAGSSDRDH